ncbi:MAG: glycosyltransferase [Bauldia sp.]
MRVLLPVHSEGLFEALMAAYAAIGWEAVVAIDDFAARTGDYDLVHVQWPEALAGWRTPSGDELSRIAGTLAWWRKRCPVIATVHNLAPHGRFENPMDRALFRRVYEGCDLVTHFSEYSRSELLRVHPELAGVQHVVHRPFLFTDLLPHAVGRDAARASFGFGDGEFVIAMTGHVREPAERRLADAGIRRARVAGKRAYFATTVKERRRHRIRRRMTEILTGRRTLPSVGRLPSPRLVALCEAADLIVIPRYPPHLNSGVMQLAMTFATPLAVPDYGLYREYLRDAGCAFYAPKRPRQLAKAIEAIAAGDREALVRRNRAAAADWGWPNNLSAILAGVRR